MIPMTHSTNILRPSSRKSILNSSSEPRSRANGLDSELEPYDYNHKEVRELFLTLVCEFFDNYDLDGFIIDSSGAMSISSLSPRRQAHPTRSWTPLPSLYETSALMLRSQPANVVAHVFYVSVLQTPRWFAKLMGLDIETWMKEKLFDIYVAEGISAIMRLWKKMSPWLKSMV